jgi:tetratricopeptide (TPR) repeat protein
MDIAFALMEVDSGSSRAAEATITEGETLAAQLDDPIALGTMLSMRGRMLFERNQIDRAIKMHAEAEQVFGSNCASIDRKIRANNLIRLAIAQRSLGLINESVGTLATALKYRPRGHGKWKLYFKILGNLGAAFLYENWRLVRRFWSRRRLVAESKGLPPRYRLDIGLAYLDLLEGNPKEAISVLDRAESSASELGLDSKLIRILLNKASCALVLGRPKVALASLREAERLCFTHYVRRRLWRVEASMANAYEYNRDMDKCYACDHRAVRILLERAVAEKRFGRQAPWLRRRDILPLINISQRAVIDPRFKNLLSQFPESARAVLREYSILVSSQREDALPGLLGKHIHSVGDRRRCIMTE